MNVKNPLDKQHISCAIYQGDFLLCYSSMKSNKPRRSRRNTKRDYGYFEFFASSRFKMAMFLNYHRFVIASIAKQSSAVKGLLHSVRNDKGREAFFSKNNLN